MVITENQRDFANHLHVLEQALGVVDGGVEPGAGVVPPPVQILCCCGTSVASIDDPVRIQHGDYLEDEGLSQ